MTATTDAVRRLARLGFRLLVIFELSVISLGVLGFLVTSHTVESMLVALVYVMFFVVFPFLFVRNSSIRQQQRRWRALNLMALIQLPWLLTLFISLTSIGGMSQIIPWAS